MKEMTFNLAIHIGNDDGPVGEPIESVNITEQVNTLLSDDRLNLDNMDTLHTWIAKTISAVGKRVHFTVKHGDKTIWEAPDEYFWENSPISVHNEITDHMQERADSIN